MPLHGKQLVEKSEEISLYIFSLLEFQNEEGNCLREIQDAVEECTEIYKTRLREVATKNGAPL